MEHRDVGGFVFVVKGPHVLSRPDRDTARILEDGDAAWADAGTTHQNPNAPDSVWFFVALRSITQRNASLPYPTSKVLYQSPDLPTPPAAKPLIHQLGLITMAAGGRTSAHSHGGSESFYVIEGTIELAVNDGTRTKIDAGHGGTVKPGRIMQMRVIGDAPVKILTYFVTPEGEPWQTNLDTVP